MKYKTHNETKIDTSGTYLLDCINVSFYKLVEKLGTRSDFYDDYKSDAEWQIVFEDGLVASIYNYKDGVNYLGEDGILTKDIRDWHIGGKSEKVVERINHILTEVDGYIKENQ